MNIEDMHDFCSEVCHETWCAETGNEYTGYENHTPTTGANCSQCFDVIGGDDEISPAFDPCEICGIVAPLDTLGKCADCVDKCGSCHLVVPLDALNCFCCCRNCEETVIEVTPDPIEESLRLEQDLFARLGRRLEEITDARLQVEPVAIVEVLSAWLADNGLAIVNDDQNIFEI